MSKSFEIEFEMNNSAFDSPYVEIPRILNDITERVKAGSFDGKIRDVNGNTVGRYGIVRRKR